MYLAQEILESQGMQVITKTLGTEEELLDKLIYIQSFNMFVFLARLTDESCPMCREHELRLI